jgi:hypothetical protein
MDKYNNIFKFKLCKILTKIQPTTAFKILIYIYCAPKSTSTFPNREDSLWLVDRREWNVQLGSADNVCEKAACIDEWIKYQLFIIKVPIRSGLDAVLFMSRT